MQRDTHRLIEQLAAEAVPVADVGAKQGFD